MNRIKSPHFAALFVVSFAFLSTPASLQSAQQPARASDERDLLFDVHDLIDGNLLRGPGYVIEDQVRLNDYRFVFYLKTNYGRLPVQGVPMLELRIREMHAIATASEWAGDPQAIAGIVQTLADTPRGLAVLVTEPEQSVQRARVGIRRMADRLTDSSDRQAGGPVRRQLAADLGCDPETRNPILDRLLDQVARRRTAGQFATKTGLGLAVPGLGLLALNAEQRDAIRTRTPTELNLSVEQAMVQIGVHRAFARRLRDEPSYTALERLLYWDQLKQLREVPGFELLVERAVDVDTEARALSTIEELRLLNNLRKNHGLTRIDLFEIPLATLRDGRNVLVCAADYVTDTSETRDAVRAYRKNDPNTETLLVISGRVSDAFRATLKANDIEPVERPKMD
jgi:hypothetical protein